MQPTGFLIVTPMVVGVNEPISIKIKVLGPIRKVNNHAEWITKKPRLKGPYNLNISRGIQYMDNALPEWEGVLEVDGEGALEGPDTIAFTGKNQGVFPGDTRPIKNCQGWKWNQPGLHWIKITDPDSGITAFSNPVMVKESVPSKRIYWGDPHWQSFLTDGIRMPEELYAFARDEAFLDFGAASDHTEGLTARQWDYFVNVTNDFNSPGNFATLVGLEWTSMAWGHRNIYYAGDYGPILRSDDPREDTLAKIWRILEDKEAIAIPHHSANQVMGVNWDYGWNPEYETAVEIHSCWGNSECSKETGNPYPIKLSKGEKKGQHVIDALKKGYRFGFVGGGDIHYGRPGDELRYYTDSIDELEVTDQQKEKWPLRSPQGFTAAITPFLTREHIYNAMKRKNTYATTQSRILLDMKLETAEMGGTFKLGNNVPELSFMGAAAEKIEKAVFVHNGDEEREFLPDDNSRVVKAEEPINTLSAGDFCYIRIITEDNNMAWSSPVWIE